MADLSPLFKFNAGALVGAAVPALAAGGVTTPSPQTAAYTRGGQARGLWLVSTSSLAGYAAFAPAAGSYIPAILAYINKNQSAIATLRGTNAALAEKTDRIWQVGIVGAASGDLYIDFMDDNRGEAAIEQTLTDGATTLAQLALVALPTTHSFGLLQGVVANSITPASADIALGTAAAPFATAAVRELLFGTGKGGVGGSDDGTHWKLPTGGGADAANAMVLGKPVADEGLPSILGLDGYPAVANYPLRGGAHGPAANIIHYSATGDAFTLAFCSHAAAAALFGANFPTAAAIDAAGGRMAPADNTLRITGHDESNQSINVTGAVVSAAGAAAASAIMVGGGLAASLALGSDDQTGVGFYRALRSATFALAAGAPLVVAGNVAAEAGLFASLRLRGREQPGASLVSAAPGANDDIDAGYVVGSRAIKTDGTAEWICTANTAGAAVWAQVRGAGVEEIWTGSETSGTHNLISGKGFDDYSMLLFIMRIDSAPGSVVRYASVYVPSGFFAVSKIGTQESEGSDSWTTVSWVSNTSFSVSTKGGGNSGEGLHKIYGISV